MTEEAAPTLVDAAPEPVTAPDPTPPINQRPAFELTTASLWNVLMAFRPAPNVDHVNIEMQLITATASGEEVYPIALDRVHELAPGALDVWIISIQRRGEVTGTVLRRRRVS